MNEKVFKAERISTPEWYKHTREWNEAGYWDAEASICPDRASAGQAHPWEITVRLGSICLQPGDHVAVEFNVGWTPHAGRPFVYGRQPFLEKWSPGYGATPGFDLPDGVECEFAVSEAEKMNRYFIIDMVIISGVIPAGGTFRIFPANPEGTLLKCAWFAQEVPVPVAVRKKDDKFYKRLRKIPLLHVTGAQPRLWKAAATLQPEHDRVEFRIVAADLENLNPVQNVPEPQLMDCEGWKVLGMKRYEGYHGAPMWKGTASRSENAAPHIEVFNREAGLYGRSNPVDSSLYGDLQVYFGDLHGQSSRSIGFGSEREYFWWGRDAALLDFVAPANHYGGRENITEEIWQYTLDLCEEFNKSGRFVTLFSYEWGGFENAHRNVYYAERPGKLFVDLHTHKYENIFRLWDALEEQKLKAITIPHHVKFIKRMDWNEFHTGYQRAVEVYSCWGNSEMCGPHSVQEGLKMGHRIGVVGGTDTHFSQPGSSAFGPFEMGGLTGVICDRLDRTSIWQAIYNRRCYATTGERILLDIRVNGHLMGSELKSDGARKISGKAVGTAELERVEIIRNNEVWKRIVPDGQNMVKFELEDGQNIEEILLKPRIPSHHDFAFYYLKVLQKDGHQAMSSPIWIAAD